MKKLRFYFLLSVMIGELSNGFGQTILWQKCLGGDSIERAYSIRQTIDEGYIIGGFSYSNNGDVIGNHGESDYWIVKLSDNTGITESIKRDINIYPNPANENIIIEGLQAGTIEIINLQGQDIKKIDVSNEKTSIDISKLFGGVYTMKIKTNDGIVVKRLIKE